MTTAPPVVFIHGLWLHASSWAPWTEVFGDAGYRTSAPGWPGVPSTVAEARVSGYTIAGHGVADVTAHYAELISRLPEKPILVGHSFGGMVAQKLLGMDLAVAAVAIDAAQIKGVLPLPLSALRATFPVFRNPANARRAVSLTPDQFRFAFGNTLTADGSRQLYERWAIPAPGRPLFEAAVANVRSGSPLAVDTANDQRGPLLLTTGGQDHTVPATITRSTLKQYRGSAAVTDLHDFPDRGHSLTIDDGWPEVADVVLTWLAAQSLAGGRSAPQATPTRA